MKKCPYCGRTIADDDNVCGYCYAEIPEEKPEQPKKATKKPEKE